ncbi:transposase-like protein [Paraburkholderia sp. GAS348]
MKTNESLPRRTKLRSSKYLNNVIEQDHCYIKSRVNIMLGFKQFQDAAVTLSDIELMHRIRKGQFNLTSWHLKDTTLPSIWRAVLAAR